MLYQFSQNRLFFIHSECTLEGTNKKALQYIPVLVNKYACTSACVKQSVPASETINVENVWLLMHIINSTRSHVGSKPKFHPSEDMLTIP